MKKEIGSHSLGKRILSLILSVVMVFGVLPLNTRAEVTAQPYDVDHTATVADPQTIGRPGSIYGNDTLNAGKVTVGKSVHNGAVTIDYGNNKSQTFTPAEDNFIVTSSQTAQVVGLASEITAPVDVVFVLDTSNSMEDEVNDLVTAANNAIKMLLSANPNNRVGVVAFSGTSGRGTSGGAAANVLSPLAHYDGDGETAHLTLQGGYMYGRGMQGNTRLNRDATSQGTNIHAGIVVGARELMNATNLQVNGVTRIPFLVVMSDGEPSYAVSGANWYDPASLTGQIGNLSQSAGIGFLPALTAAYYKGKITEKYFGTDANKDNRCFVYTLGLGLESISNRDLALMTVNPAGQTASNSFYNTFEGYWNNNRDDSYVGGKDFNVALNRGSYKITADTITATKNAVNGLGSTGASLGYTGGYKYNDKYFSASQGSQLNSAFSDVIVSIQQQAMSAPTRVETVHGADFSGYVTYTDPIGEYMEVKKIYGVLADGNYYQGKAFAEYISDWDNAPAEFKTSMIKVLKERCKVTGATMSDAQAEAFLKAAADSANQANYDKTTGEFDNSIVWWGKSYKVEGEEDVQIQWLGFADNDTVNYIESTQAPEGADYICRSYYFYGTVGGTIQANSEFLHFVVRVQRSLKAPYQETVVVSAPASLLSMEKVLITEKTDNRGNKSYTASVTEADPARVVYEVGLRSDINAFNVEQILKQDPAYLNETAVNGGQTIHPNYDAAKGEYYFYTNDWNRGESEGSHHRAMTHATFDAAADNSFYTYTNDTPIYTKDGDTYTLYNGTTKPSGVYYYAREYYDWSASDATGNTHTAQKKTAYILVDIPADSAAVKQGTDGWYIAKGAYKASSLSTAAEDVPKNPNNTGTSTIVAHPHRTTSETNSHYTVLLGNNGKLSLKAADTKSVSITKPNKPVITDGNGKVVMVGDELAYTIKVVNGGANAADATVTDAIPVGTVYVDGSASEGGTYDSAEKKITWNIDDIPAGHFVEVSFKVTVTEAALTGNNDVVTINNTAFVTLTNGYSYTTNTTTNPPEGKKVVDSDGASITGAVDIPDVLVYRIRWHNDSGKTATVKVTDIIPAGTTYVQNSASHNGVYDAANKTITWTMENVEADASGVVSFRVNVNAAAGSVVENGAQIQIGDNDPRITNKTTVDVAKGDLVLSKSVITNGFDAADDQTFTLNITEVGLGLNGTFPMRKNGTAVADGITFVNGVATVTIQHNDVIEIQGITAGAIISVAEAAKTGFTASYTVNDSNEASDTEGRVTIAANADVSVAVTNTYMPKAVDFALKGVKKLETSLPLGNTTFGFVAGACDGNGTLLTGDAASVLTGEVTVSSAANEAVITFADVVFSEAKTYYYLISEINGGVTGVTYAEDEYLLTVVVTDNGSGILQAAATLKQRPNANTSFGSEAAYTDTGVVFTNTYVPKETQLVLEATKVLAGRNLKAGEFSFVVTENGNVVTTGTNDANGKIQFRPITYSTTGSHSYTITEVNGGLKGVVYSTDTFTVAVNVTDNNGHLVADPIYPAGGVKFVNTYTPDDVQLNLSATKTLTNNAGDPAFDLKAEQFAFVVLDQTGNQVAFGNNDANGAIAFSPISYTKAMLGDDNTETFTYTVKELIPDELGKNPNMKYDVTVYTVTVTVTYDPQSGAMTVGTPAYKSGDQDAGSIVFNNIQHPTYIDVPLAGNKTTTGSNQPVGLSFSFSVADTTGAVVSGGTAPATGAISFTNLSYTTTGTHYYWIYESNHAGQQAHGVTYSGMCYVAKVEITRDGDGKMIHNVTYYKAEGALNAQGKPADPANYAAYAIDANKVPAGETITFTNVYAAAGSLELEATKILTVPAGSSHGIVAGDYLFRLDRLDATGAVISSLYATNDGSGKISFPSIVFTNEDLSKTFRYVMSEEVTDANRLPGVTYNTTKYYIEVVLTADGSDIIATPTYYSDAAFQTVYTGALEFVNAYAPATGTSATFRVQKELTGRELAAGEFSFLLYHVTEDGQGNVTETLVDTSTNTVSATDKYKGEAIFIRNYAPTVTPGTYKYAIVEHAGNLNGVTYSTAKYWALVTIRDTGSGTLECDGVTYYSGVECTEAQKITDLTAVKFVNAYDAQDTTFTPAAKKVLENRVMSDNEFSFIVMEGNTVVSTGWSKADGTVVFTPIGYTAAGVHTYTISEVKGNLPQVTYTDTAYELKVAVVDDTQTGRLVATGVYTGLAENAVPVFTNTYTPSNTSVQLQATKKLENHAMKDGTFSFVVRDAAGNVVATGGNAAAAANETVPVTFSNIGFTFDMLKGEASKAFIYSISEQPTTHSGVTIDNNTYYAKIMLTHNSDGTLTTDVSYYKDAACQQAIDGTVPAFVNRYDPADATVTLYADKTLINKKLAENEFTFTLTPQGGTPITAKNDATGRATFPAQTFTEPGTYYFTISEAVTNSGVADRYTLDHSFKVIVTVEDNLRGQLVATVTYHEIFADGSYDEKVNLGGAEFINHYTAPPITVNLTESIGATKTVNTPDSVTYSKAGFKFRVTDTTGKIIKGWSNGAEIDMIGVSDADGKIAFPSFRFDTAGEYHYWITEQPSGVEGMTDDLRTWEVHILVRYNEETGVLDVSSQDVQTYLVGNAASETAKPGFVNVFDPVPLKLTLEATKLLEGREMKDREFLFYLMQGDVIAAQAYNDGTGKVKFDLNYTAADIGDHAYTIKEVVPENANNGVTYDGTTHVAVTVSVSYDTANRKLVASVNNTPVANGAVVSTGVTVTNKYAAEAATVQINANKVVTANRLLKDKEFTFGLMDSEGKVVATAKNDAAGWITFQMTYDKVGTYTYKMFEQPGGDKSLVYDNTRFDVVVTVTDDQNGKLHAVVTYKNDTVPTFVNEYRALSTTATITAKKVLKGNKTLAAGDFTFELEREDGAKVTVKNAAGGVVLFGMRYDAAGVYTYKLREIAGDAAGMTYDDAEYTVIVTVMDNLEGSLVATVAYEGLATGETVPTFVNTYKGKAASARIAANKVLSGKALTADAFSFTLTNKDNSKDVYTAKNDAKGNVVFDLNLTEVGTYTYILAETAGTDANVTYDKATYTVTVKVTDDLEGSLKAEVTYDTADGKAPTFQNTYTPSAITVELTGEKKLSGRDMKKEEFKFEVRDDDGNVVATARNDAEGKLAFSAITLEKAGKYVFTVTEVKGGVKGMIYDDTVYEVTVEVVNDNGQLKATVTEPESGLVFENTYKNPDPSNPGTGDDMPLLLLVGMMVISGGAVVVLLASRKKRSR